VLRSLAPKHTDLQSNNKRRISAEEWQRKLREVPVRKEDMNRVVMNFLVTEVRYRACRRGAGSCQRRRRRARLPPLVPVSNEHLCGAVQGYVDVARTFERESGTAPGVDLDQVQCLLSALVAAAAVVWRSALPQRLACEPR